MLLTTTALPLLDVAAVSFAYPNGATVLDRLSIVVPEGSITGVVGPSGCGKSTLLALLAGLLTPDSGRIAWAPETAEPPRHPLTMMFQKDTLLPWLTVEGNIGLHFRVSASRLSKEQQRARISVRQELVQNARLLGASNWRILTAIRLQFVMAWTLASLPLSVTFAIISVVTAEILTGVPGMGSLLGTAAVTGNSALTFAVVIMLAVVGVAITLAADAIRKRVLHWWGY